VRAAELAVLLRRPLEEAEGALLSASPPLVYRAVKLNIRAGRWARALEVAQQRKEHVDTVLALRARHLATVLSGARETLPQFVAAAAAFAAANGGAAPDWAAIKARNHALKQREAQVAAQQQAQQAQQQTQQTHQPAPQSQQLGALGPRAIAGGRAGDRGAPDGGKDDEVGFLG
jgi:hypothetical protein